jgi:ATP-dependent DNA ligase
MALPVAPPLQPMLAKLERSIPDDRPYVFEPKWDGFRHS